MSVEDFEIPEPMGAFFDARAEGYDDHMRRNVFETDTVCAGFYQALATPIPETDERLEILDLGCGTGLELEAIFGRAPNAAITGIDLSGEMLDRLRAAHSDRESQIKLVTGSYLTLSLGTDAYDFAVSAMANHHLLHEPKRELYTRIRAALRPGGRYVEADSVIPAAMEAEFIAGYHTECACVPPADDGHYHIDVPFSLETQRSLLLSAGFRDFRLLWRTAFNEVWGAAVYVVTA